MFRYFRLILMGVLLILLAHSPVDGQNVAGLIRGVVVDDSGAVVPAADLTLTNTANGAALKTAANAESGLFVFPSVAAGTYELQARAPGFKNYQMKNIVLTAGELRELGRITLSIGEVSESISVQDTAAPLQMASGEKSGLVSGTQLNELTLKGRDFYGLMTLIPGVVDNGSQDRDGTSSDAIAGIYINGGRTEMKNITVDAVSSVSAGSNNNTPFQPNMDTIAEVKVLTSNYQAEYGKSGAGVISVVTKSGGREFHGSGWWTHRHEQLNANNFFNNRTGTAKSPYRYDIFGFSAGGPVTIPRLFNTGRNKLFFFASQEYTRQQIDHGTRFVNMPTELERAGDFSKSFDVNGRVISVRDPPSNAAFPGNRIPVSRINKLGQSILNFFPLPNYTDPDPALVYRRNYKAAASGPHPRRNDMIRVDAYASSKLYGYYRFIHDGDEAEYPFQYFNFSYAPVIHPFPGKGHAAHLIYTVSPRLLNDFTVGQWGGGNRWLPKEPEKVMRSVLGDIPQWYPNEVTSNIDSHQVDAQKMPNVSFGSTPVSPPSISPNGQIHYNPGNNWEATNNVSVIAGSHNIKAGFYYAYFSPVNINGAQWNGILNFAVNANNPNNTGHSFGNALLGYFYSYTESTRGVHFVNKQYAVDFFAQDNWRATRRLTLDFGMRFYHLKPTEDIRRSFSTFDPSTYNRAKAPRLYMPGLNERGQRVAVDTVTGTAAPNVLIGTFVPGSGDAANGMKVGGVDGYPAGLFTYRTLSAAPRFGFAYDVLGTGKTVVRGGVGTFLDRPRNLLINANQPPIGYTPTAYYGSLDAFSATSGAIGPSTMQTPFPARKAQLPSVTSFSLAIQRQLPFSTVIDAAYVGTVSSHLPQLRNLNAIAIGARFDPANADATQGGRPLPDDFYRPYAGYSTINILELAASSNYHSLQVSAQRRFSSNVGFGVAYTFSKALGSAETFNDGVSPYFSPRSRDYGPLGFDRSQVLTVNYVYDLPDPGKHWRKPFMSAVIGRWSVSGVTSFMSGAPFTPGISTTTGADLTGSTEGATPSAL